MKLLVPWLRKSCFRGLPRLSDPKFGLFRGHLRSKPKDFQNWRNTDQNVPFDRVVTKKWFAKKMRKFVGGLTCWLQPVCIVTVDRNRKRRERRARVLLLADATERPAPHRTYTYSVDKLYSIRCHKQIKGSKAIKSVKINPVKIFWKSNTLGGWLYVYWKVSLKKLPGFSRQFQRWIADFPI